MLKRRLPRTQAALWLAALSVVPVTVAFSAQEGTEETKGTPAAGAPAGEAVTLAFKYRTGGVQRFQATIKQGLTISPEGGGVGLGAIPVENTISLGYHEKVSGMRDGVATIAIQLGSMSLDTNAMGTHFQLKAQNGKVTALVNGQPAPGGAPGMGPEALQALAKQPPMIVRRDARGVQTAVDVPGVPVADALASNATALQFPEGPVKVGESWESVQKFRPSAPGGLARGAQLPELEMRTTHTLKEIQVRNGKRYAMIESVGESQAQNTPDSPLKQFDQSYSGTTRFDLGRGAIVSGQYKIGFGMLLAMPQGAPMPPPGGPEGPTGMRLDGTADVTLREVVAAPAPARAKKPAPRRSRSRRR